MTQTSPSEQMTGSPSEYGSGDVQSRLTFIVPQETKPYFNSSALTGGQPEIFFETEDHEVTIRDMRPLVGELSINRQGFEFRRHPTQVDNLHDDETVDKLYDQEIVALLQEVTGADRVVVFDRTRRSDHPAGSAIEMDFGVRPTGRTWTTRWARVRSGPPTRWGPRRSSAFSAPGGASCR